MSVLSDESLALLFLDARTHNGWQDRPVEDALLKRLYEVARMAPTSANSNPMRIVFVKSAAAKARLMPAVAEGNAEKTKAAPVTAIIAYDTKFYDEMPKLFPARDMKSALSGMPEAAQAAFALLNSSLQGGYIILAARALGLDCGPMAGFDKAKVDAEFFADGRFKSTFLINLGYGDPSKLWPRNPRLSFEDACKIE